MNSLLRGPEGYFDYVLSVGLMLSLLLMLMIMMHWSPAAPLRGSTGAQEISPPILAQAPVGGLAASASQPSQADEGESYTDEMLSLFSANSVSANSSKGC